MGEKKSRYFIKISSEHLVKCDVTGVSIIAYLLAKCFCVVLLVGQ